VRDPQRTDALNQCVAVVALGDHHGIGLEALDQCGALGNIGRLSGSRDHADRIAQCIPQVWPLVVRPPFD